MKHAREDYNRFQDPALKDPSLLSQGSSPMAEDEPVMLFRAKDKFFTLVLRAYLDLLKDDPSVSPQMVKAIEKHYDIALEWRAENGTKTPDMPTDAPDAQPERGEGG